MSLHNYCRAKQRKSSLCLLSFLPGNTSETHPSCFVCISAPKHTQWSIRLSVHQALLQVWAARLSWPLHHHSERCVLSDLTRVCPGSFMDMRLSSAPYLQGWAWPASVGNSFRIRSRGWGSERAVRHHRVTLQMHKQPFRPFFPPLSDKHSWDTWTPPLGSLSPLRHEVGNYPPAKCSGLTFSGAEPPNEGCRSLIWIYPWNIKAFPHGLPVSLGTASMIMWIQHFCSLLNPFQLISDDQSLPLPLLRVSPVVGPSFQGLFYSFNHI